MATSHSSSSPDSDILRSELPPAMDLRQLRYSMVWEDIELLYQGLDIQPGDHVLSVSSAGDNVLNLLLADPAHITAIDLSMAQNALLDLKLVAIRSLSYEAFVSLLGLGGRNQNNNVQQLYQQICPDLPPYAQKYWDRNKQMLEDGLILQGRLEQYFHKWRKQEVFTRYSQKQLESYLRSDHSDPLAAFERMWGGEGFKKGFLHFFGAENLARQGRDPAQFRFVEHGEVGAYFFNRFQFVCTQLPMQKNGYLEAFLLGKPLDNATLPPYLKEKNYAVLQSRLDRITVVTEELETYLPRQAPGSFHKGNFSDLFEYVSEAHFEALLQMIHRSFQAGGRIAYWNLLVPRRCPASMQEQFRYCEVLSQQLWRQDRSWFYRDFVIEERMP